MKDIVKRVPLPTAGVVLGTASLGTLLRSHSEIYFVICGCLAAIMMALLLLKIVMFPKMAQEDLKNPVIAGVFAAFPMSFMVFAVYLKPLIGNIAYYIWLCAVICHALYIVFITLRFVVKFDLSKIFASFFIVYCGIVVASVTAPAFNMQALGTGIFWYGFAAFIVSFALIAYRYVKLNKFPDPLKPIASIFTAPLSLCLAGYCSSVSPKSAEFITGMLVCATALYIYSLINAVRCLKFKFFPSFAAFTFPFVISAVAARQSANSLSALGNPSPLVNTLATAELVIAAAFMAFSYTKFTLHIFEGAKAAPTK